jgi:hypothetical protein
MDMDSVANPVYSATASFTFDEFESAPNSGTFTGRAFVDFFIKSNGELTIGQTVINPDATAPTKGAGVVYRGKWTSHATKQNKPFILSNNAFMIAPELLPQFGISERSGRMNPKYAKLGWSEAWENDEWWADSPKPSLNL